jgi:hypothetical protein
MCDCFPGFISSDCSQRVCPAARAWLFFFKFYQLPYFILINKNKKQKTKNKGSIFQMQTTQLMQILLSVRIWVLAIESLAFAPADLGSAEQRAT